MTDSSEIQQLREEIQELRFLYLKLAKTLIPEEQATPEDLESINAPDGTMSKDEFLRALEETPVKKRKKPSVLGRC
jgi:hypothetical protein